MAISTMFFQFIVIKKLFFGPYGKPPAAPNCLTVFSEALGLESNWDHFGKLGAAGGFAPGLRIYQILALNGLFKLFSEPLAHVPGNHNVWQLFLNPGSKYGWFEVRKSWIWWFSYKKNFRECGLKMTFFVQFTVLITLLFGFCAHIPKEPQCFTDISQAWVKI